MTACPTCGAPYDPLHDEPSAPATSDDRHRRALLGGVKALIESQKRARTTVNEGEPTT